MPAWDTDNYIVVALRKESVDRNCDSDPVTDKAWASLSARRAWIEIDGNRRCGWWPGVALRKESVDRNCLLPTFFSLLFRRSPQGERG